MAKQSWYTISAREATGGKKASADIYVFDEIGMWGVTARDFIADLRAVTAEEINLHINSPGGDVFDGIAIQNSLKMHKARVVVHVDGLAASIASVIALGGDEVRIAVNAYVMIHNPTSWVWGEAEDMKKQAELLDKITDGIAGDYARKMNVTVAEARALMDAETWYLGQEAVDAGFADVTYEGAEVAANFDLKKISNKAPADAVAMFKNTGKPATKTPTEAQAMGNTKDKAGADAGKGTEENGNTDANTDVNANANTSQNNANGETAKKEPEAKGKPVDGDVDAKVKAALAADRKRAADIMDIGEKFGFVAEAKQFAKDDKTVEDFRAHVLAKSPDQWRDTLAVKNPSNMGDSDTDGDDEDGNELRERVLAMRKKRQGLA